MFCPVALGKANKFTDKKTLCSLKKKKYQEVKEFQLLVRLGLYLKMMVVGTFSIKILYYLPSKSNN